MLQLQINPSLNKLEPVVRQVAILWAIFAGFYFFEMASFPVSIDEETAAFRSQPWIWIEQGRWAQALFERFILPRPTIPFLPIAAFGVFAALSYLVILRALEITRLGVAHYALFPIFAAFPTWFFLAEFYSNIAAIGAALLLVSCSTYLFGKVFDKVESGRPGVALPIAGLLAACSGMSALALGVYQTFLITAAVLGGGLLLWNTIQVQYCPKIILSSALLLLVSLLGSAVVNQIVVAISLRLADLHLSYIGNYFSVEHLLSQPTQALSNMFWQMMEVYGGAPQTFGIAAPTFILLPLIGLGCILSHPHLSGNIGRRVLCVLLLLAMVVAPFALRVISPVPIPQRSLVALPIAMWFIALLGLVDPRRSVAIVTAVAVLLVTCQTLYIANILQAQAVFVRTHDQLLASRLYHRIAKANPTFDTKKVEKVDIYGGVPFHAPYPHPEGSTAVGSFFAWDGGNAFRIHLYMRLLGFSNLELITPEERARYVHEFGSMPKWPAEGSVKRIDDITLIKLGDEPGITHQGLK